MSKLSDKYPIYSKLLKLYPAAYHKQYSDQMIQTLDDMLKDSNRSKTAVWLRASLDLPFSLIKQQLSYTAVAMSKETPNYIKQIGVLSTLLLTPFFTFLTLDAITSHSLYSSWFWHPIVVFIWLILMPALAFTISSATLVYWLHQKKNGSWKGLFDWHHNWTMLTVIVLSLGIIALAFGHDSVHCVVNNPVKEIRNWHTTWTCIKNG